MLDEIETANRKIHGYGSLNFGRNLQQCYQHLAEREIRRGGPDDRDGASPSAFCEAPMEVIEGVPETLGYLAGAPRSDAVHQGPSGGTEAEDRPLRAWAGSSRTRRS